MEDGFRGESMKEPVAFGAFGEAQVVPTYLFGGIPPYRGPQRTRDQLGSQTDAEDGLPPRHGLADQLHFVLEVRQIVVDGHWAAEEDQSFIRGDIRHRGAAFV